MSRRRQALAGTSETPITIGVLKLLHHDPRVAMAWRQNTGGAYYDKPGGGRQFVRFGPKGGSDLMGVTRDGRFLAIETKRDWSEWPRPERFELWASMPRTVLNKDQRRLLDQRLFLLAVREAGGLAGIACAVDEALPILGGVRTRL